MGLNVVNGEDLGAGHAQRIPVHTHRIHEGARAKIHEDEDKKITFS